MRVFTLGVVAGVLGVAATTFAQEEYRGSTFSEVRDVVLNRGAEPQGEPATTEHGAYRAGRLPQYRVTAGSFTRSGVDLLKQAAIRTTTRKEDFYPRLPKLLHPNGICFTGNWEITEPSDYSGYFARGAHALFVGRASVALNDTVAGTRRGFGFAGKLFPTRNVGERVRTANFFSVDVLMGTNARHFTEVALTNEPEVGFDLFLIPLGLKILRSLTAADESPLFRPLYPISELGVAPGAAVRTPKWMRVRALAGTPRVAERDFRHELAVRHYRGGLKMEIAVSDTTKDAASEDGWRHLGFIELRESAVSYGCDRQLHFAHPKLRR